MHKGKMFLVLRENKMHRFHRFDSLYEYGCLETLSKTFWFSVDKRTADLKDMFNNPNK